MIKEKNGHFYSNKIFDGYVNFLKVSYCDKHFNELTLDIYTTNPVMDATFEIVWQAILKKDSYSTLNSWFSLTKEEVDLKYQLIDDVIKNI
jgi:hypothetical protein